MKLFPSLRTSLSCGLLTVAMLPLSPSFSSAAEWLAPAADEQITADWVKSVSQALRSNRFKNVFMNQAYGCDQCRILEYLNDAADALESDEPKLAKSFLRRALRVLDDGVETGWYDEADVRPIKRLIIKKANKGLREAGAPKLAMSVPRDRGQDPRYQRGDEPLFSRSDADQGYGSRQDRWSGYTSGRRLGITNEPPDRDGRSTRDSYSEDVAESDSGARSSRPTRDRHARMRGDQDRGSQDSRDMSRKEFRRANQRNYEQATDDNRFATAQDLKESANDRYDSDPFFGPQGRIRQPGD